MAKIILDKPFLELFPEARVGVVYAKGIIQLVWESQGVGQIIGKIRKWQKKLAI